MSLDDCWRYIGTVPPKQENKEFLDYANEESITVLDDLYAANWAKDKLSEVNKHGKNKAKNNP